MVFKKCGISKKKTKVKTTPYESAGASLCDCMKSYRHEAGNSGYNFTQANLFLIFR